MRKWVEQYDGSYVEEEATPKCGEDFCEECGGCLACYGGDPCWYNDGGDHYWFGYFEE